MVRVELVIMSFIANPISEHEVRRQKYLEDFKSYVKQEAAQTEKHPISVSRRPDLFEYSPLIPSKFDLDSLNQERKSLAQRQQHLEAQSRYDAPQAPRAELSPSNVSRRKPINEPVVEYFPFGKPGAGAPLKKHTTLPQAQYEATPKMTLNKSPSYEAPRQTTNYDAQKRIEKEEQQKAYRELLNEQMMDKHRKEAIDKQRRMQEDQIEETRIRKQLEELEDERKREGLLRAPKPQAFESVPEAHEAPRKKRRAAESPTPMLDPSPVYRREAQSFASAKPLRPVHEKFRLSNDTSSQQAALQQMMNQMKAGAEAAKREHTEAIIEFDQLRLELKMKGEPSVMYQSPVAIASRRQLEPSRRWQLSDSKFIPLRQAGASALKSGQVHSDASQDYFDLSNQQAKHQLAKLDEMLRYQLRAGEPQTWVDDQAPLEESGPQDLHDMTSYMADRF